MHAQKTVKLWEGNPPTNNELENQNPELTIYSPETASNTGMAVVICPGGGYSGLAMDHEGKQVGEWLIKQGITGIVLKYRLPNKHKGVPLEDAQQAIRYVREHAKELNINPDKIGIAGFSAGGHLASTASTHYATYGTSTRPDFSILFYPVITMEVATHGGSKKNLLGDNPSVSDVYMFSNEKQVNTNTPPTILLLSDDDKSVLPVNSTLYYDALKRNDIPATMYIFPEGGHGWGMRENFKYHKQMLELLGMWLKDMNEKLDK
ncbi:acetyl esterase/lipase [Dysgonomonas hofstadii]|uniref:Acetyl esterase/lipase n=2 Tax=Dysgonomonas hofstadii TaxID=637886 RepID=A0A840CEX7_9BACT|nr:alpha/beta hydrolase [Dysgonomonas hofstadii]MBB4034510.1 acetyl esterase/lipase [Dysgonomonas hofstadii]